MIFSMKIKIKVFCKLALSFVLVIAKYAQSTQNSKFVISLFFIFVSFCNISKRKGGMKLIFCMQISIKLSQKVDPINRDGHGQAYPNYPK